MIQNGHAFFWWLISKGTLHYQKKKTFKKGDRSLEKRKTTASTPGDLGTNPYGLDRWFSSFPFRATHLGLFGFPQVGRFISFLTVSRTLSPRTSLGALRLATSLPFLSPQQLRAICSDGLWGGLGPLSGRVPDGSGAVRDTIPLVR